MSIPFRVGQGILSLFSASDLGLIFRFFPYSTNLVVWLVLPSQWVSCLFFPLCGSRDPLGKSSRRSIWALTRSQAQFACSRSVGIIDRFLPLRVVPIFWQEVPKYFAWEHSGVLVPGPWWYRPPSLARLRPFSVWVFINLKFLESLFPQHQRSRDFF